VEDDAFYARHVQCRSSSLGVMTSGGTAANIQAN
jgi:glutamate/tyrosine decarboxylase-like PLP-dependent enzyme